MEKISLKKKNTKNYYVVLSKLTDNLQINPSRNDLAAPRKVDAIKGF